MNTNKKIDPQAVMEYIRVYQASYTDIAKKFNCDPSSISRIATANGLFRGRGRKNYVSYEEVALYAERHPRVKQAVIAKKFGITQSHASHICLRFGVKRGRRGHARPAALVARIMKAIRDNPLLSYTDLAAKLGVKYWTVWDIAQSKGFKRSAGLRKGMPAFKKLQLGHKLWWTNLTPEAKAEYCAKRSAGVARAKEKANGG